MNFLQLQQEFADLQIDLSSAWVAWWDSNKSCLNKAYEYLYDKLKNSEKVKLYLWLVRTKITFLNNVASLPADFDTIDKVYTVEATTDRCVDWDLDNRYYDFEVTGARWSKKMTIQDGYTDLYITYLPIIDTMTLDTDTPTKLPDELHRSIVDFAIFEYFRRQRDTIEMSNALQLANSVLNDKLKSL